MITLCALSQPLEIKLPPEQVNRNILLEAMKGKVLGSSEIKVVYSRSGTDELKRQRAPAPPADPDRRSGYPKPPDDWVKDLLPPARN